MQIMFNNMVLDEQSCILGPIISKSKSFNKLFDARFEFYSKK